MHGLEVPENGPVGAILRFPVNTSTTARVANSTKDPLHSPLDAGQQFTVRLTRFIVARGGASRG